MLFNCHFPILDETGFLESGVGAVSLNSLDGASGNDHRDGLIQFWDKDFLFLEIRKTTLLTDGVELRGASAVAITTTDLRFCF